MRSYGILVPILLATGFNQNSATWIHGNLGHQIRTSPDPRNCTGCRDSGTQWRLLRWCFLIPGYPGSKVSVSNMLNYCSNCDQHVGKEYIPQTSRPIDYYVHVRMFCSSWICKFSVCSLSYLLRCCLQDVKIAWCYLNAPLQRRWLGKKSEHLCEWDDNLRNDSWFSHSDVIGTSGWVGPRNFASGWHWNISCHCWSSDRRQGSSGLLIHPIVDSLIILC